MTRYAITLTDIEWDRGNEPEYLDAELPDTLTYVVHADDPSDAHDEALARATDDHCFCIEASNHTCKAL